MGYRDHLAGINKTLGNALRAANGDESAERAACEAAVEAFRKAEENADNMTFAEMLRDGDDDIEGAFDIAAASDEEYERWTDILADAADY